jgi:DNA-binding transcriptional regulator YiaG
VREIVDSLDYQVKLIEKVKIELGMSQSDIARKFKVGTSVVSKWAKGKASMTEATKIALELMIEREQDKKIIDWVRDIPQIIDLVKYKT